MVGGFGPERRQRAHEISSRPRHPRTPVASTFRSHRARARSTRGRRRRMPSLLNGALVAVCVEFALVAAVSILALAVAVVVSVL